MRLLLLMLVLTSLAGAQQIGQNARPGDPGGYTLSVKSQLVVETVVVKDKKGAAIPGLTAKDFTVTEDNAPQTVRFVEHQQLPSTPTPAPAQPENVKIYKTLNRTQITPEAEGKARYNNRRLLVFYFDMSAMRPADQLRALAAAEKFIRTQMTEADMVSILRYAGGSVDVLQDFTGDRNRLLSILETLIVGEGQGLAESNDDASGADAGAAFGQDDGEFNVFNTDRQLAALQTTAKMLGQLNEKKSLVYFASGLRLNGVDNQAQLHATVDAAVRAGVSFWPIDARGLVASAPLGDATQGSPGNAGMYNGAAAQANVTNLQRSQDTLFALAGDTGGKAMLDSNDLAHGIVQAQQAISDYYIVGYYTTNPAQNGRFRKVKIALSNGLEARLEYREGYYAGKTFAKFTAVDKERQLEDALMLNDPITELTIAMEIDYFQLNRAEYYVPIIVKIPGRELALAKRGGAEHTLIDFVGEVKDVVGGTTVTNLRDNVNIKLSDASAGELARRPIEYDAGFTLLPGKYMIKFLARDDETGRIGTYQTTFTVPNLNKELKHVPISAVILSSQRVNMKDALYNAMKSKDAAKAAIADPLVENGSRLIPSVNRVFSRDRELYVFLQAYQPGTQPVVAYVSLYRGGAKVFESQPAAVTPAATSRLGMTPLSFTLSLGQLPPGDYDCQVTVLDPTGNRSSFWQAPILIVP
ncbi:VWFA-related domain-containing protein [Granulicella rosea]|uniref:VWFA-related domain-containing protein n=1 Tax=Granulicella rosea TaxID=474952 RepID=A0A239M5M3_9BACT|nr:VWA domain-containing protein [Granulicella rosea]SNT37961.1 VWFA-related domain-containing protein [Granulicella rosea]